MYPFSPKLPSHQNYSITLSRPVLSSRSLLVLVIHFKYSSVYMSIPNSLTILSPHPSSLLTQQPLSSFSKSVSPFLLCKLLDLYHFVNYFTCFLSFQTLHIRDVIFLFLCLTSLGMTISRAIHVAAKGIRCILLMKEI